VEENALAILLMIVVPIVILFACAVGLIWVPLPSFVPPPLSQARNLLAAVTTGVLGMGYLVTLTVYLVSAFWGAGRALEHVCTSLGLVSQSYALVGRQYRGTVRGRQVSIDFLPARGFAPGVLNVYVQTNLPAKIAVGNQPPMLDCGNCPSVVLTDPEMGQLVVLAEQEALAHSLLGDPRVQAAVKRLMVRSKAGGPQSALRELYLQPERVWFRTHPRRLREDQFQAILHDLLDLAEAAAP
jgi:hypothetical protein